MFAGSPAWQLTPRWGPEASRKLKGIRNSTMIGRTFSRTRLVALLASMVALTCGTAIAADFTVVNKCSYTVFPGI